VVTQYFDDFQYNRAIGAVHELTNALSALEGDGVDGKADGTAWALREGLETLARLIEPMMPHLAEEMWHQLGHAELVCECRWPKPDAELVREESVTIAVQVAGKLRATLEVAPDLPRADVESAALAHDNVRKAIAGRAVRKVIVVPNRVVNVVV